MNEMKRTKRFRLSKETIRQITNGKMQDIEGGTSVPPGAILKIQIKLIRAIVTKTCDLQPFP